MSANQAVSDRVKEAVARETLERLRRQAAAAPPEVEVEPEPEKPIEVGPNQKLFSTLVGKTLLPKGMRDFAVDLLTEATIPVEIRQFVPPVRTGYNIQIEEAHALLLGWQSKDCVLITGPTGSGKSSLVDYCCALTGRPHIRVNSAGDMETSSFVGQLVVEEGATVWRDGPVTDAVKYGAVISIDEWDVTPSEVLMSMQWLFEEDGKLFLKEKPGSVADKLYVPHENFRIVCLGNTLGQGDEFGRYSGTTVQNNASVDRFQTTIVLDYLEQKHEVKIITDNCKGTAKVTAQKMVQLAQQVRTAHQQGNCNLTMSPRTLINWARKTVAYGDNRRAFVFSFLNKLRDSDRKLVGELFHKTFGERI